MTQGVPAQLLQAVGMGGVVERPLLAPLCSAIAGELQALPPDVFLRDVTKLSNAIRDLVRALNVDVAVAEFGTLWDAEALGVPLDWSAGFPPKPQGTLLATATPNFMNGRGPVVTEAVRRLQALLGDRVVVAAGVTGPARLARLSAGALSPVDVAVIVLSAVRLLCEAGAKLIWVVDDSEPLGDAVVLAHAMQPVWQSIRFYQGTGVLHVAGAADGWTSLIGVGGPYLPCFNPVQSPELAAYAHSTQCMYGLALPPGAVDQAARELACTGRCVLVTNTAELAGTVAARDLRKAVNVLRSATS